MPKQLPHDPYITAVVEALTAAHLEPTEHWTDADDLDPYRDDDAAGAATMLSAVLDWDDEHPAVVPTAHRYGIALLWHHPAEGWLWAPNADTLGRLAHDPQFVPGLGRYADPDAVATAVRTLLAGRDPDEEPAPEWAAVADVRAAVDAWAAAEG
jgi:hypothetical protein